MPPNAFTNFACWPLHTVHNKVHQKLFFLVICTRKGGEKCSGDYCVPPDYDKMRLPQVSQFSSYRVSLHSLEEVHTFLLSSFLAGIPPSHSDITQHCPHISLSLSSLCVADTAERKGEEMEPKKTTEKSVDLLKYIVVKAFILL
jgi:hypothetical protein